MFNAIRLAAWTLALLPALTWAQDQDPPKQDAPPPTTSWLLKGATVVVKPGQTLAATDILVREGKIVAIGKGLRAPAGVETVDCTGLTAYAGFIHPLYRVNIEGVVPSTTGLSAAEIARKRDEDPLSKKSQNLAGIDTATLEAKDLSALRNLALGGFTAANVSASGGIFGPRSAVVDTFYRSVEKDSVMPSTSTVPIGLRRGGGFGSYPGSTMGVIAFIRQAFYDAQYHSRVLKAVASKKAGVEAPEADPALEALAGVLSGASVPVFEDLNEVSAHMAAELAKEFGIRPVFVMSSDSGSLRNVFSTARAVVLRGTIPSRPRIDDLEIASLGAVRAYFGEVQAGAELQRSGVAFCFGPSSVANPLAGLRTYVRGGLDRNSALASLTTRPAELLGLANEMGTLEQGKRASIVLTQGDLFDSSSQIMAVFSSGKRIDFDMPDRKKGDELKPDAPLKLVPPKYGRFPAPAETAPAFRLYRNATIWTMGPQGVLSNADLLIRDGKIQAVGRGLQIPQGCQVIDASGMHLSPGIWDCHSHTGISGGVNEGANMVTIECRIQDVTDHTQIGIYRQLSGGTVGANQLHGSANAIGGQSFTVKWRWGEPPTRFGVEGAPPGVKFALGENPIREPAGRGGGAQATPDGTTLLTWRPQTRMGVEEAIRRALQLGKEYAEQWQAYREGTLPIEPRRDIQLEGLAEIVTQKRWVHSHGYRQDELLMLLRVVSEFGGKLATLQHVLEGYKIADEMAASGVGGSTFADWWGYKLEAYDAIPHNAALMAMRGVSVSINSDSDNHARRLNHEAAKAIRYGGVPAEKALSFVTIEPARQLGIDSRTGSLEPGKDADIAVWTADPTSVFAVCMQTYVDGVLKFDRDADARQRSERIEELQAAKEALSAPEPETDPDNPFASTASAGNAEADADEGKAEVKPASEGGASVATGLGPITGFPGTVRYPRKSFLIRGATLHPMVAEPFVGDLLVGADGRIAQMGANLSPEGVEVIDGSGKHVYPGLIDSSTTLGLMEIGQVPQSDDSVEKGDFHPDYRVERTINAEHQTLAVARAQGVLTALVRQSVGSGIAGQAAVINTEGYTFEDIAIQGGVAMVASAGGGGFARFEEEESHVHIDEMYEAGAQGRGGQAGRQGPSYERLNRALKETREYLEQRAKAIPGSPVPFDARYEAMVPVLDGKMPVMIAANSAQDMKAAVAWAEEQKVRVQLYGCSGAGEIADWLAEKKVPIILSAVFSMPGADLPTESFYALPAKLAKAGVRFCLSTNDSHDVRQLREHAGFAAAFGLKREDALRSVTLWAAEILGMADRIGSLRPGLEATVVLASGDLLETRTVVEKAWISGREVGLQNKQSLLYDKYRFRPLPTFGGTTGGSKE